MFITMPFDKYVQVNPITPFSFLFENLKIYFTCSLKFSSQTIAKFNNIKFSMFHSLTYFLSRV